MSAARVLLAGGLVWLAGCAGSDEPPGRPAAEPPNRPVAPAPRSGQAEPPNRQAAEPTIVFLGTSLTAGLGLDPDSAYPALVQERINNARLAFRVVNAGVSGESSAGALRRIDWVLRQQPWMLVIETGANDGLRGQDPDSIRANIQGIIDRVRVTTPETRIVLAGMEAMPNLGSDYVRRFRRIYPDLARANGLTLIPFLLDGVAGVDSLNQQDGIHPNSAGARRAADNVWRVLRPLLETGAPGG